MKAITESANRVFTEIKRHRTSSGKQFEGARNSCLTRIGRPGDSAPLRPEGLRSRPRASTA